MALPRSRRSVVAMRTLARRLGTALAVAGVLLVVYAAMVVFWRDPVTSIYTAYEQHEMRSQLGKTFVTWREDARKELAVGATLPPTGTHGGATVTPAVDSAAVLRSARRLASRFAGAERGHTGRPLGRIRISRIGLSTIVVENTDYWGSLSKGPGRYEEGSFPGLGQTTGIAGHRTTFAAPFRHIDSIRDGDPIVLQMPYGTFTYRVLRHEIVDNGDWSIMRRVGFDELVLSACHPLYSASHRYVVFARLASVELPGSRASVPVPPRTATSA
jgi:sortase A